MKLCTYEAIINDITCLGQMKKDECVNLLIEKYPYIRKDTFMSIYSLFYQRKIKKAFKIHHRKENIWQYYRNYKKSVLNKESEGFVLRLSKKIDFPSTLLMRIIMEQYFLETEYSEKGNVPKGYVSKFIKDPTLLTDQLLKREVEICIENDNYCGPIVENIKRETGLFYEKLLHNLLKEKDIPYYAEDVLREEGYDKTPDFKLVVPISINNYVINWIESKASFGDLESHTGYLQNQFWSYTNRFGPGLVIYWFGFIHELNNNIDQGIMLMDKFSEEISRLDTLLDEDEEKFVLTT